MIKKTCVVLVLLSLFGFKHQSSSLLVEISGLASTKGQLGVALYSSSKGFPSDAQHAVLRAYYPISGSTTKVRLPDLAPGTYALAVYHDANNNKTMDKNIFGVPKEMFGFSQNPQVNFKAPSFEECAFTLTGSPKTIRLSLQSF